MSPLATLFVALVALYLLECLLIVPDDAHVLVEGRKGVWRLAGRAFALGAMRKRVVLLSPFAPHAAVLVVPAWKSARAGRPRRGSSARVRQQATQERGPARRRLQQ